MKSVRGVLLGVIGFLGLELLVARAIAPLMPWLLLGLVVVLILSVVVRGGG